LHSPAPHERPVYRNAACANEAYGSIDVIPDFDGLQWLHVYVDRDG
jgi:hypothetical protein